jgi:predicted DNA-binding transcriptional regulator AlpA
MLSALMTRAEAVQYLGISIATFWRLIAAGEAPPHIQLSRRRVGYRVEDLDAWLLSRRIGTLINAPTARQMIDGTA